MQLEIAEKKDLDELADKFFQVMETFSADPFKEWFVKEDLARLRHCSISQLNANPLLLPNYGVPEDRFGAQIAWSRSSTLEWLKKTRIQLEEEAARLTSDDLDRIEWLKANRKGGARLPKLVQNA